jgi:hypothetical protein
MGCGHLAIGVTMAMEQPMKIVLFVLQQAVVLLVTMDTCIMVLVSIIVQQATME